jgi:hypothetical protein
MKSIDVVEPSLEKRKKANLKVLSALVLCAVALGVFGTALSLLQVSRTVSNVGSVRGVGVGIYWDSACTNRTSSINWGMLDPGSNKTVTVYVRNEGNTVVTLSKTVQNWNPVNASMYISLTWDYAGSPVLVNATAPITLELSVASNVTGITTFSFDIIIIGSG